ncbi:capsule biosynthesis protein [Roseicella aquatilis]|uniref:Capsular biosynthesis protein n=1 Tax=Roseicella aquatilis TaxID=2527868 RepID=A0A4R4DSA1_9PROT|nr:capsular biosynthesis protein [Roseicella aquatilis]TCZ64462.1 capsular biosynthesis protein [Roseicella aquatilis]
MVSLPPAPPRRFLFLQGPVSPFFAELAATLRGLGHATRRINLCLGDRLFWDGSDATDYHGRARDWPGFIAAFLERERITDLVLLGEQRPYHKAAIAQARARGIAVTVTDYGYIRPDWIVLERDGMGAESRFPRDPAAILALAEHCPPPDLFHRYADDFALQARWDVAAHLASMLPWPFPRYESYLLHHPVPAYLGTGWRLLRRRAATARDAAMLAALPACGPLYLFAMQMENDYSIRAYSSFPDNDSALRATVGSFARGAPPDAQLLVKVHPLDPGLKRWGARLGRIAAEAGVAGRVHLMDGALGADPAILASQGVVTVNSTLGVQAIALGRPVMALGRAIYDIPGLAWQGEPDAFWQAAAAPDPVLADAFIRAIAACLHVRGRFYGRPGLQVAVAGAARRLHLDLLNHPLPEVCV